MYLYITSMDRNHVMGGTGGTYHYQGKMEQTAMVDQMTACDWGGRGAKKKWKRKYVHSLYPSLSVTSPDQDGTQQLSKTLCAALAPTCFCCPAVALNP